MNDGAKLIEDTARKLWKEFYTFESPEAFDMRSEMREPVIRIAKQILIGLDVYVKDPDQSLPENPFDPLDERKSYSQYHETGIEIKQAKFIKVIHISEIIKEVEK